MRSMWPPMVKNLVTGKEEGRKRQAPSVGRAQRSEPCRVVPRGLNGLGWSEPWTDGQDEKGRWHLQALKTQIPSTGTRLTQRTLSTSGVKGMKVACVRAPEP